MLKKIRILVLGAGGFIGTNLVNKIIENENYFALQIAGLNVTKFVACKKMDLFDGYITRDLLDKCSCPDVIYHIAGGSSVALSVTDPEYDFNLTIPNINVLLNKIRADWPKCRLVYISSAAVYGLNASDSISVNTLLSPMSPYGLHKQLAEQLIEYYSKMYALSVVIVRPFSVYGEGLKKQLFWDVLNKAQRGDYSYFGTGEEKRDWIYVRDLVDLLLELGVRDFDSSLKIINAGTGHSVKIKDAIQRTLYLAGYQQSPRFSNSEKIGDPDDLVAAAKEQYEYLSFFKTNFDEGIVKYINWFKGLKK
ncbi:dTDP-glucose 4,6 dehydratase [Aeromonas salmonicida]|nr:dTDP-glucose 4,6 dehydratase [Aeromonas salmonicida]